MSLKRIFLLIILIAVGACTKKAPTEASKPMTPEELFARGESVYKSSCIACHNIDPAKDGSVGPAVSGSSMELLTARIMYAKYPEGYKAKRPTQQMAALPYLQNEIPALHAYLNSIK